jgi:general secretion pathway protein G
MESQAILPVRRRVAGFTLIEVLVVVVILGILAAIIVPNLMEKPGQARITKAKADIRAVESALNMYRLDRHIYPTTDEGLESLVPTYLPRAPMDPWSRPYQYLSPGTQGDFSGNVWALRRRAVNSVYTLDFTPTAASGWRGLAQPAGQGGGQSLQPTAQFKLPRGTQPIQPPAAWSPGAVQ